PTRRSSDLGNRRLDHDERLRPLLRRPLPGTDVCAVPQESPLRRVKVRAMKQPLLVAEGVLLQFMRRNEFYVVLILLGIYLAGLMILRLTGGIDSVEMQRFVLALGLSLSASFAAILVAAFASRQLPEEFENRTLHPLLAKPISRSQVLLGKFLGVLAIGIGSLLIFTLVCWVP